MPRLECIPLCKIDAYRLLDFLKTRVEQGEFGGQSIEKTDQFEALLYYLEEEFCVTRQKRYFTFSSKVARSFPPRRAEKKIGPDLELETFRTEGGQTNWEEKVHPNIWATIDQMLRAPEASSKMILDEFSLSLSHECEQSLIYELLETS
jgi:hypothetical protein